MRTSLTILFGILCSTVSVAAQTPRYKVLDRFAIGGEGGWDCLTVDPADHRLYVSRGTHVMVVDTLTGKVVGDVPDTNGVHGIAIANKHHKGFISCGRDNVVMVIDTQTLRETAKIKVGENPDVIMYDAATDRIVTGNGRSLNATVINAADNSVIATVALGGKPEFAVSDGKSHVFVNLEDKGEIVEFDEVSGTIMKSWSVAPGTEPTGLAYDRRHSRLYSACSNNLLIVSDAKTGQVVGQAKIGSGPDGAEFDAGLGVVLVPGGSDGTLAVVEAGQRDTYTVKQSLTTEVSARTMALDPKTHRAYLIAAEFEAPTSGQRRGRMKPGSTVILVVGPDQH